MKKFALLIFVLFAIETWGVIGAWQTQRVTRTCNMKVGPLCFAWEENALGKMLGEKKSDELDDALAKAKEVWEKDFVEKAAKKKDVDKALDDVRDGIEEAKKKVQETVEDMKK